MLIIRLIILISSPAPDLLMPWLFCLMIDDIARFWYVLFDDDFVCWAKAQRCAQMMRMPRRAVRDAYAMRERRFMPDIIPFVRFYFLIFRYFYYYYDILTMMDPHVYLLLFDADSFCFWFDAWWSDAYLFWYADVLFCPRSAFLMFCAAPHARSRHACAWLFWYLCWWCLMFDFDYLFAILLFAWCFIIDPADAWFSRWWFDYSFACLSPDIRRSDYLHYYFDLILFVWCLIPAWLLSLLMPDIDADTPDFDDMMFCLPADIDDDIDYSLMFEMSIRLLLLLIFDDIRWSFSFAWYLMSMTMIYYFDYYLFDYFAWWFYLLLFRWYLIYSDMPDPDVRPLILIHDYYYRYLLIFDFARFMIILSLFDFAFDVFFIFRCWFARSRDARRWLMPLRAWLFIIISFFHLMLMIMPVYFSSDIFIHFSSFAWLFRCPTLPFRSIIPYYFRCSFRYYFDLFVSIIIYSFRPSIISIIDAFHFFFFDVHSLIPPTSFFFFYYSSFRLIFLPAWCPYSFSLFFFDYSSMIFSLLSIISSIFRLRLRYSFHYFPIFRLIHFIRLFSLMFIARLFSLLFPVPALILLIHAVWLLFFRYLFWFICYFDIILMICLMIYLTFVYWSWLFDIWYFYLIIVDVLMPPDACVYDDARPWWGTARKISTMLTYYFLIHFDYSYTILSLLLLFARSLLFWRWCWLCWCLILIIYYFLLLFLLRYVLFIYYFVLTTMLTSLMMIHDVVLFCLFWSFVHYFDFDPCLIQRFDMPALILLIIDDVSMFDSLFCCSICLFHVFRSLMLLILFCSMFILTMIWFDFIWYLFFCLMSTMFRYYVWWSLYAWLFHALFVCRYLSLFSPDPSIFDARYWYRPDYLFTMPDITFIISY